MYGSKSSGATTLLSAIEALFSLSWKAGQNTSIAIRPSDCNGLLDEFPTVMGTRKAVQQLSSVKAPDADVIPERSLRLGLPVAEKLTKLFHCVWKGTSRDRLNQKKEHL